MSVQAISWVLEHSASRLAARHVLISIANHCDSTGENSYPSVRTIARESRISEREVQRSLRVLVSLGELSIEPNAGPHSVNLYSLPRLRGDVLSPDNLSEATVGPDVVTSPTAKGDTSGSAIRKNRPEPSRKPEHLHPAATKLAERLRDRIEQNNPSARVTSGQVAKWAVVADRMIRRDGRSETEIRNLIDWSQNDEFWSTNILSMEKLRAQFDQLTLRRERDRRKMVTDQNNDDFECGLEPPEWTGL